MISLLIPTMNRSDFLIRLLRYYRALGFQGCICIGDSSDAVHVERTKKAIQELQDKLPDLDFEGKRLALDMLGVTVWLDGQTVEVTGTIEPESQVLRCTHHPYVRSMVVG